MKQKLLKPSLREKKRYLVYETICENKIESEDVKEEIIKKFSELFGSLTYSKANIEFIQSEGNKGIIKVNNKYLDNLRASFCFVRKINKEDAIVRSSGVSGMINKARTKFIHGGVE